MNYRKLSAFLLALIIYAIVLVTAYFIIKDLHLSEISDRKRIKVSLKEIEREKPKPKPKPKKIEKKYEEVKIPKEKKIAPEQKLPKRVTKQITQQKLPKKVDKPQPPSTHVEKRRAPVVKKSSESIKQQIEKKALVKKRKKFKKIVKRDINESIKQQKKSPLYNSIMALPATKPDKKKKKKLVSKNLIGQPIEKLYGDDLNRMSKYQRDYILNNAGMMQQITQRVLNRVGRINIPSQMHFSSSNIIEFKLHPSGDISDIKLLESAGFKILDETTRETIEYAYKDYPHPQEVITVRFIVGYLLRGF